MLSKMKLFISMNICELIKCCNCILEIDRKMFNIDFQYCYIVLLLFYQKFFYMFVSYYYKLKYCFIDKFG